MTTAPNWGSRKDWAESVDIRKVSLRSRRTYWAQQDASVGVSQTGRKAGTAGLGYSCSLSLFSSASEC